jgi:O-antigen ligase
MFTVLVALIFVRPFFTSLVNPYLDIVYSAGLMACVIIWALTEKPCAAHIKPVLLPLCLFLAGTLASMVWAHDRVKSFLEYYKLLPCVLIFYAASHFDDTKRRVCIRAVLGSGLIVCILAIYQYVIGFPHLAAYMKANHITSPLAEGYLLSKRVFAPFVTPNILAGYCAMIIPLALIEKKYRWLALPLGLVLLMTRSIGGVLALSAALYLSLIIFTKFKPERLIILTFLLVLIGFIVIMRMVKSSHSTDPFFSYAMRIEYWRNTLEVIQSAPILGIGHGNLNISKSVYAHNSYLQLWAESGLAALAGFIWLCVAVIKRATRSYLAYPRRAETPFLVCCVFVFLFHNMVDFSFFLPEASMTWWVMLGLLRGE